MRLLVTHRIGVLVRLLAVAWLVGVGVDARAQDVVTDGPDVSAAPAVSTGEVKIEVERYGMGGMVRRGEWAGFRLRLTDSLDKPRNVLVRLQGKDPDGDPAVYEETIALSGPEPVGCWVYHRLPFGFDDRGLVATVHEALDGGSTGRFRAGRSLGRLLVMPRNTSMIRPPAEAFVAVIGGTDYDLQSYSNTTDDTFLVQGHEVSRLVMLSQPNELPDRAVGISAIDSIVWGSGEPSTLVGANRRALREWVERGGHLVIILPSAGQTWTNENLTDLYDIMPLVSVSKKENAEIDPLRWMLTSSTKAKLPERGTLHTFKPLPDALPGEAMPILNDADGNCVVVRRLVGTGAVTWIGIDLNLGDFRRPDSIQADVFWHRIFGKRGSGAAPADGTRAALGGARDRRKWVFDEAIPMEIGKTGQSATGVLLGFVVFGLYWLVAGPVGYLLLKQKGQRQHAWLAFVGATAVFTAVAWGGATILRPGKVEATHLTVLDHVYGQPVQRARMFASVLIPRYGTAEIRVGEGESDTSDVTGTDVIAAWDEPESTGGIGFPDARPYYTDSGSLDTMRIPVRQTIKQIRADWVGGPTWKMPIPVSADPTATGAGVIKLETPGYVRDKAMVSGVLTHGLPGVLRDITIVVVTGQQDVQKQTPGSRTLGENYRAYAFIHPEWPAGDPLDLALVTNKARVQPFRDFVRRLRPNLSQYDMASTASQFPNQRVDQLTAWAFFNQLEPPELESDDLGLRYAAQRWSTHGWDLGRWFTQPCVIIVGHLAPEAASPVPLSLDGEPVVTKGRTIVRWVYPLPPGPPGFAKPGVEAVIDAVTEEKTVDPFQGPRDAAPGSGIKLVEPGQGGGRP